MTQICLDCKGLPCPQPVLRCREAIDTSGLEGFSVVVDNEAARENVSRFLDQKGYEASVAAEGEGVYTITARRLSAGAAEHDACEVMDEGEVAAVGGRRQICALITADVMGAGDDELGAKLMQNFLSTLPELGGDLWRIMLVNGGVKLTSGEHPASQKLLDLAEAGVDVLACGVCLEHFGLSDAKVVGQTTNMLDIVTSLQLAGKVIRI
jgi:selenium metabolism protein YedF